MPNKIDSNLTGLRYADELTLGALPGSGVVWKPLEPNSYGDFGSNTSTTPRNPLSASRQRQKGVVTDVDASGSFDSDLTLDNMYDLLQGFFFADWRKKDEDPATAVTAGAYTIASGGTDFRANDLILGSGFAVVANNGLKPVTASTGTSVTATGAVVEASPPAGAKIKRVGHQFASGDATIAVSGGIASLNTTTKDCTQLGLIPGEWIWIGGDLAAENFINATVNKGFARVASVTTNKITFDKTSFTFVTDAGTAKTVRIFIGDVLKNENDPLLIKQRSYHLERSLGTAGYEYLKGSVPNEMTFQLSGQSKATVNLSFVSTVSEEVAVGGVKAGTRPDLTTSNVAFNTSADFSRLRLDKTDQTGLASYLMEASLKINNGVTPMKALGVLGSVDVSLGDFAVTGDVTAYFSDITAIASVKSNADISFDFALCTRNAGMLLDMPLLALGNGRLQVAKDTPIKLPVSLDGAAHATLKHTLLCTHYSYLPAAAEA